MLGCLLQVSLLSPTSLPAKLGHFISLFGWGALLCGGPANSIVITVCTSVLFCPYIMFPGSVSLLRLMEGR